VIRFDFPAGNYAKRMPTVIWSMAKGISRTADKALNAQSANSCRSGGNTLQPSRKRTKTTGTTIAAKSLEISIGARCAQNCHEIDVAPD
jgi:hypothetical protein